MQSCADVIDMKRMSMNYLLVESLLRLHSNANAKLANAIRTAYVNVDQSPNLWRYIFDFSDKRYFGPCDVYFIRRPSLANLLQKHFFLLFVSFLVGAFRRKTQTIVVTFLFLRPTK